MGSSIREKLTLTDLLTRDDVMEGLATRDALLASGVRLIHRYGVQGTSIGKLLEVTSKSKSQFYFHFEDKDDFVCKVLELEMTTMLKMKRRFPLERIEDLDGWFSPYLELGSLPGNLGCPVGPAATEMSPSNERVREEAARQFERWEIKIAEDLQGLAEKEGLHHGFCARTAARNLACSIQGAFMFGRVFQNPAFIEGVRDNLKSELKRFKP